MSLRSIVKDAAVTEMIGYYAAGTSAIVSSRVLDMSGYDSCAFIGAVGTVTAGGVIKVIPRHGATSSSTGMVDMSTAAAATTASTTAHTRQTLIAEIHRPTKRYVSVKLHRATQNAVVEGVIAIRYNAHGGLHFPLSQSTGAGGVIASTLTVAPTT